MRLITALIDKWSLTRQQIIDLAIGVSTLILHEFFAKPYYRHFIYSNNIDDFHIADTLGNTLGTITAIFIVVGLMGRNKTKNDFLIKVTTISIILYELAQPLLGKPIDPWDIMATVLTGIACIFLYGIIHPNKI